MGGKSSTPDAPDYGPLIAGLGKVIEKSLGNSDEMMKWAKQVYKENKATGDVVTDFSMGQLDKMAAWADADRQRYEDIYQPLEEQQAVRAQDYLTPERQEQEAGKAEADVAAQFEQARNVAQQRLEAFGVDPSQTRAGALDLGTRVAEGAAAASAGNQARFRTEQYGDQLMANAIATGKGYPQQVLAEASGAAGSGNQAVNTGLATTASGAQTMGTPYQWTGLGMQGYGQQGQLMHAGYADEMDKWKAEQEASSGWGSVLGTVASFIPGFAEGGAIPDDGMMDGEMVPHGASPSGGAIPDDIDAEISETGQPAKINAGEFIVPKDVVSWLGEKGMQQIVLKARKEMGNGEQRPAQPETGPPSGPPPGPPPGPPVPSRGAGAIPDMEEMA
ncbi:MAG TPA: hypothetical protein VMS92_02600 [Mycobacterium sp.]|nr:hypothetical protein [Mycobacterium sp.]